MKRMNTRLTQQTGTSLIEVLIALFLTGIITMSIMKLYTTQHNNYIVQDDVTAIQQNARASIDELTRQIRMAGHQLPAGLDAMEFANTDPDTITITYRHDGCDNYLSSPMPQPSSELKCGADVSCLEDGQWVYIFDPDSGGGEFFEITHVQTGSNHIQHNTMTLSRAYDANAIILSMNRVRFYVDNTTDPDHPALMMETLRHGPQIYADNITDLQFRYRLTNGNIVDVPALAEDVREVLISVSGRGNNPDYELSTDEDDYYRSRTYSSSVSLRNVGL